MNLLAVVVILVVLVAVTPLPLRLPPSTRGSLSPPSPPLLPEGESEVEEELTHMKEEGWGRNGKLRTHKEEKEERRIQRGKEVLYYKGKVRVNKIPDDRHARTHYDTFHNTESTYTIAGVEKRLISKDNSEGKESESDMNWEGKRPENYVENSEKVWSSEENEEKSEKFWSSEENEEKSEKFWSSEENEDNVRRRNFFGGETDTQERKRETEWGVRMGEPLVLPYTQDKKTNQDLPDRTGEPFVLPYIQDKSLYEDLPDELMPIRPGGGSRFDDLEREKLEREKMAQTKGVEGNTAGTAASHDAESLSSAAASLCLSSFILSSTSFRLLL